MSMHKIPLTPLEEEGLRLHGLPIGTPSQRSDTFRQGVAWAIGEAKRLTEENERLRVQLAGCGVAAMQNTADSRAHRITRDDYGWSASYADVCSAVDREISLREENERLRVDADRYRWLRDYSSTSHLVCRMFVTRYIGSATIPVYQGSSLDAATRRAIVRAAAEIGRGMK